MDNNAKEYLLCKVLNEAKHFSKNRKRIKMTSRDVHDALHALGLRPLYSSIDVNGDESVKTADLASSDMTVSCKPFSLTVSVASGWIDTLTSADNFRRRKLALSDRFNFLQLSEKSKFYVKKVVNGHVTVQPSSDSDVLIASWFLGLHFTDTVVEGGADWKFVRWCLMFLEKAKRMHAKQYKQEFPQYLFAPWTTGLERIADGSVNVKCESASQDALVKKVCRKFLG